MTTLTKIESNRRNAQRSTGPRTRTGKTASSRNALRHGLLATEITLPDEDPAAVEAVRTQMTAEFAPHPGCDRRGRPVEARPV